MAALKYSRQREAIKTYLMNCKTHPTADTIYSSLRMEYPNISLGTVYRNLSLLTELGEIAKISTGDSAEHYDGDTSLHHHFICTCCHRVYDLPTTDLGNILENASKDCPGRIEFYRANFYGICEQCLTSR